MADLLKSVIQDLINDRSEQARATMHSYIVAKTQEIAGLSEAISDEELAVAIIKEVLQLMEEGSLGEVIEDALGYDMPTSTYYGCEFKPKSQFPIEKIAEFDKLSQFDFVKVVGDKLQIKLEIESEGTINDHWMTQPPDEQLDLHSLHADPDALVDKKPKKPEPPPVIQTLPKTAEVTLEVPKASDSVLDDLRVVDHEVTDLWHREMEFTDDDDDDYAEDDEGDDDD